MNLSAEKTHELDDKIAKRDELAASQHPTMELNITYIYIEIIYMLYIYIYIYGDIYIYIVGNAAVGIIII